MLMIKMDRLSKALHVLHVYHEDESRPLTILSRHPYCSLNSFDLNVHCLIVLFSAAVLRAYGVYVTTRNLLTIIRHP